jgi:hypothetical protein
MEQKCCIGAENTVFLTSTYEWLENQIIFEVTSGKELQTTHGVKSYSILNLQKAVLRKMN